MRKIGFLSDVFKRNSEITQSYDFEFINDPAQRIYLKEAVLETCINFIGRNIAQSEFRFINDGKRVKDDWDYLLNVRPNTDQSASDFWQRLIYKLIFDNEVLVVLSDTDDLLIADSFLRKEFALYTDIFESVVVKNYQFQRNFSMDEVIYLTYNNKKLTRFMDGLFNDYGELFGRMMEASQRGYQIRAKVNVEAQQSLDDENRNKLQGFIDKLFGAIKSNSVALLPMFKGFGYDEVAKGDVKGPSIEELTKIKRALTDDVAEILGIPTSLIHGDMADFETAIKAYIKFCNDPLVKKISDELNAKLIDKKDYLKGNKIKVKSVQAINPLELAEAVDKLVGSGAYSRNDVREKFGDERVDDPELDKYVLTKNYQTVDQASKGGET